MQLKRTNLFKATGLRKLSLAGVWIAVLLSTLVLVQACNKLRDVLDPKFGPKKAVDLKRIGGTFVSPIGVVPVPDDSKRLFVIDQVGKVWIIEAGGSQHFTPFLDLTDRLVTLNPNFDERGLQGLAFHPDYKNNGRFFVYYNAPAKAGGPEPGVLWNNVDRISEFKVSSNPNQADMNSEKILLELNDPQFNHNGGTLAFGPTDGYLYISIGDGGGANDVGPGHVQDWYTGNAGGNGQEIEAELFGNILRLDVNNGNPYGIPQDNPFVGKPGRDEIYAYGFRNPYRFSFDLKGSNQLFVGDAGQVLYEEIDIVTKGGNYGWNVKEATHCFNAGNNMVEQPFCPSVDEFGNPLIDPIIELNNWSNPAGGRATTIIGGHVYRGQAIPDLYGKYIFGTFSQNFTAPNAELYKASPSGPGLWPFEEISLKSSPNDIGYFLKGFGQDWEGEIYLAVSSVLGLTGNTGKVFKLVPAK